RRHGPPAPAGGEVVLRLGRTGADARHPRHGDRAGARPVAARPARRPRPGHRIGVHRHPVGGAVREPAVPARRQQAQADQRRRGAGQGDAARRAADHPGRRVQPDRADQDGDVPPGHRTPVRQRRTADGGGVTADQGGRGGVTADQGGRGGVTADQGGGGAAGARRGGRGGPGGSSGMDRWLLTYADMITLLLALFVVLFALSSLNAKKFTAFRLGLAQTFSDAPIKTAPTDASSLVRQTGLLIHPTATGATPTATPSVDSASLPE